MRSWWCAGVVVAACQSPSTDPTTRPTGSTTPSVACFEAEDVRPMLAVDVATEGGASRIVGEVIELCGAGAGLHPSGDAHHYAFRRAIGDVDAQTSVLSIDAQGTAALVLRSDEQAADRARAAIGVREDPEGTIRIVTRVRAEDGGDDTVAEEGPPVELPVTLRLVRAGTQLEASYAVGEGPSVVTWSGDVGGQRLGTPAVAIGLAQASDQRDLHARAMFSPMRFAGRTSPPPDVDGCAPTTVPEGAPLRLTGVNLDQVTAASVAGVPASIVSQGSGEIVVVPRPGASQGRIHLTAPEWGVLQVAGSITTLGTPFVRGDLDRDGVVDTDDLAELGDVLAADRSIADCPEAADIDADGDVDDDDLSQLRSHLTTGGPPPAAPWPKPAAPDGAFVCGLPAPPVITAVRGPDGSALAGDLAQGDEVIVIVDDLPDSAARLDVRFGDVSTTLLEEDALGLPGAVRLRVGVVPSSGARCPTWMHDLGAPARDGDLRERRHVATGLLYELGPTASPGLCPRFTSTGVSQLVPLALDDEAGELFLPVRDSAWPAGERLRLELDLPLPTVWGGSRGARRVSLTHRIAGVSYPDRLDRLASDLQRLLTTDPDCACDVDVTADVERGGIVFEPCDPQVKDPPGPLSPPNLPWQPAPAKKWAGTSYQAPSTQPVSCKDVGAFAEDPRQFMWCAFAEVVATRPNATPALPRWEWFHPHRALVEHPGVTEYFEQGWIAPPERPVQDKHILYNGMGLSSAFSGGYHDPCAQAATLSYCPQAPGRMPPFDPASVVVKTFWLTLSALPSTADPGDYYSYQPPSGPRQYLGGLHLNVATGEDRDYWRWATFWVEAPVGDRTRRDGGPLAYNDACTEGTGADRPEALPEPWQHYVMCVDPGDQNTCGNPWAPANECKSKSCAGCHEQYWSSSDANGGGRPLFIAWLPTLQSEAAFDACYSEIEAARDGGTDLYASKAPWECRP